MKRQTPLPGDTPTPKGRFSYEIKDMLVLEYKSTPSNPNMVLYWVFDEEGHKLGEDRCKFEIATPDSVKKAINAHIHHNRTKWTLMRDLQGRHEVGPKPRR